MPGTNSHGILTGFNKTVLHTLPRSRNLIVVESVLMAVAFLAMLLVGLGSGEGVQTGEEAMPEPLKLGKGGSILPQE